MKERIETTINGDRVFLIKLKDGYKVIHPIKIDGKIYWKNLIAGGNWWNLVKIGFIVIVVLGCVWEYSQAKAIADSCLQTICKF